MTEEQFRRMALSFPEASEGGHMGHPDFRVGGKIFATLWPKPGWAMVKLTPEQQEFFLHAEPAAFSRIEGGWGWAGATSVQLRAAKKGLLHEALLAAWRNRAPKRLLKQFDSE